MPKPPLTLRFGKRLRRLLNKTFSLYLGGERRPVFLDVDSTVPELRRIDQHFEEIKAELLAVLPERARMPLYHEMSPVQRGISAKTPEAWRVLHLHSYAATSPNRDLCPRTAEIVGSIPGVLGSFFSILEPGKSIPPHYGPLMGFVRYHTAFVVPKNNPPRLRVKDQWYTWKEGESVLFDDTWDHEVVNECDEVRVILVTDLVRPMPWVLKRLCYFWEWYKRRVHANPDIATAALRPESSAPSQAAPQA